ncbi:MAG: phosphodiester glycosidase family protein [Treponema sp.]|nr:phosphodiester glycosidase family protein [Treponema sp.]
MPASCLNAIARVKVSINQLITITRKPAEKNCPLHLGNKLGSGGNFPKRAFAFLLCLIPFLTCFAIISCASAPDSRESGQLKTFQTVENIQPQWEVFAGGIDFFHGKVTSVRIEFWALRVDLSAQNLRIVVRGGATAQDGGTLSAKVSSFARDNKLIAGINAVPFDVVSSKEGQAIKNSGLVVSDGKLISPLNPRYDVLVFFRDGSKEQKLKAAIVEQSSIYTTVNIENAVGGFHQILKNGQTTERTLVSDVRHPRSAAGISSDTRYLYFLVIDGRRIGSVGGTEKETALLLRSLGSWDGLNFDGGGSSALVLRFPDGKIKAVNTPIHRFPGQERAVAGCIGISLSMAPE